MARALAEGAQAAGFECRELPLADGGEGTLEALGGANRAAVVTGPLGEPVEAGWRLEGGTAVIEAARAAGLSLAGGADANDPVGASTRGVGELIAAALAEGAERVIVAVGGSATTDGGLGAAEALGWEPFPVPVRVACDVQTPFLEAANVFAPQKGATPEQVDSLADDWPSSPSATAQSSPSYPAREPRAASPAGSPSSGPSSSPDSISSRPRLGSKPRSTTPIS